MPENALAYQRFLAELKRRRVFRVMAVYGALAFAIIEASDVILPRMGMPDWTVSLVVWFALIGFPVAIALAWAFDVTPQGVQRTGEAAPGELTKIIAAPASKRWPAGLLALVGVVALVAGAWFAGRNTASTSAAESVADRPAGSESGTHSDATTGPSPESIAVLPFVNMSSDPEQEFFSDGISEELLNLLAQIPELQVAARTSSFSFKDQNLEIPEIAERLKVAHVLEGSVRKAGNQVRITAQLIRADDGFHMWSDTWDRSLDDIFAIQDEIAADVAQQLKVTLLGSAPKVVETDPAAYALYLQARQLSHQITLENLEHAVTLYQQALAIDPDYAAAWAGLASSYTMQTGNGLRSIDEGAALAREAADRALAIDPEYAAAYAALGQIEQTLTNDLAAAAPYISRALRLEPTNPDIISRAATLARDLGRLDEASALFEYAVARDPVNSSGHHNLGTVYLWSGRLDEAIASFQTALALSPGRIASQYGIGSALLVAGDAEAALDAFALEEGDEEYRIKGMALAFHDLGRMAEFEAAFRELRDTWGERWPSEVAHVYAWIGDVDAAFEWLDRGVLLNEDGLGSQYLRPLLAPLHEDPRWLEFRERTGTSDEQLATIEFEVTLPQ
ncbi:MAG: tetratricopeptide repeat protein [Gemmatimonadetes bacterium]|nr:tetratricopeptide repeat protein [Gemmatimonadota bacterium]